ncbi:MAG: HEPN domain-containing protein [Magnetococcus sp. THC-1_WYH]
MSDFETARQLLTMAGQDLHVMTILAAAEHTPEEAFGFHTQQAVEKAFKAWLALLGREPPRIHNLRTLVLLLEECGVETTALWDFTELTPFAVQFRYESLGGMDVGLDCVDWLKRVRDLVNRVEALRVELNNG